MAITVYSDEWARALKDEVNKSSAYKAAAKGWKWTVGLVVEAEPDKNFPEATGVVMDLFDGDARDIHVGTAADAQKCDFVITAPYTRWKEVALKQLDATRGMLQGKLKLKGDLPTIVRYTKGSQELVECTTRIPVVWPDEK
jgi:putative sterol carrier protein